MSFAGLPTQEQASFLSYSSRHPVWLIPAPWCLGQTPFWARTISSTSPWYLNALCFRGDALYLWIALLGSPPGGLQFWIDATKIVERNVSSFFLGLSWRALTSCPWNCTCTGHTHSPAVDRRKKWKLQIVSAPKPTILTATRFGTGLTSETES